MSVLFYNLSFITIAVKVTVVISSEVDTGYAAGVILYASGYTSMMVFFFFLLLL